MDKFKHYCIYIENTDFCGIWDEFQAWATSKDDPGLLNEISSETDNMEQEYLDDEDIEEGTNWDTKITPWEDMHYSKEIEDDTPMIYDGRNNS